MCPWTLAQPMRVKRALTTNLCRRANAFITPSSFEIHLGSSQLHCGTRTGIVMKRTLVAALVAGSLSAPIFALAAEGDQQASRTDRMQQWTADRETMLE